MPSSNSNWTPWIPTIEELYHRCQASKEATAEALELLWRAASTNTNIDDIAPIVAAKETLKAALGLEPSE